MANPQEATQDIGPDPDLSFARLAAIGQTPPAPPPPEHPMIAFARNLLNPANYAQEPFDSGTYTPPMPSPTQPQMPAGFNPYAAPADQRGASTDPFATIGQANVDIHQAVSNLPILGGIAQFGQDTANRTPLATAFGYNPATAGLTQGTPEYRSAVGQSLAAGIIGPESEGSQIAGGLKNRIGAPSSVAGDIAAEGAGPVQTAAQKAGALPDWVAKTAEGRLAQSGQLEAEAKQIFEGLAGPDALKARQVASLKASGATDAQIADFQKTMAPASAPKPRIIQTAEGQAVDPGLLTRSLQTAAGQEGVPLSQHPDFAAYGKGGPKVGPKGALGGDIGTATRAVMAGDPKAMSILGPDLTQQLIQNKIAQIVRETGAPEDVIRRGLSVMVGRSGPDAAGAISADVVRAGRDASPRTGWSDTPSTPAPEPVVAPPQVSIPSDPAAAAAPVAPPLPSVTSSVNDYTNLVNSMRAQGATEDEIGSFLGKKPPPPTSGEPPIPPVGGKDGMPPNLPPVTRAQMGSAIFRNYIVSNSLSPFTLAIKSTADLVKTVDTTLEAVTQGFRAGTPAQIPGSIRALYGGFMRGVTQDAITAFKNRSYALGGEGKTVVLDQMLSGKLGNGARRFAQASDVISLGSPIPRSISALTSIFQRGYRDMALYQEGYAQAASKGLKGGEADAFAAKFMADPLSQTGGKAALERATAEANTRTWTNSNPLSRIPGRDKPIMGDALFTVTPFVNLVTNIAREGLEYIPVVGAAVKGAEAAMKGGLSGAEWARVAQHQFMGAAGVYVLGQKASVGEVTGDGPDQGTTAGQSKYFDLVQQGWKPNHIKIGDTWYPNIAFGPIAPLLNSIGNTHDNLVYNTAAQDRESVGSKAGSALNGVIKGELDTAHWLDALLNLSSAINGSKSEQQQFVNQWVSLFVPQSGTLKTVERVQEPATPAISPNADLMESMRQRFFRQYPPAFRPSDLQNMQPGVPRAETGPSAALPFLGSQSQGGGYDGVGVPEGNPNYGTDTILREAARLGALDNSWRSGGIINSPAPNIGKGDSQIRLDATSAQSYIQTVGEQRQKVIGALLSSSEYQNATQAQQQAKFDAALKKADDYGKSVFLAKGVIDATDPNLIQAQAVSGFNAQGTNKDKAYWVALLDRAGKLTPDVVAAIDKLKEPVPGEKAALTVDEYLKAAPLIHQYLAHVPFGSDAHPIGTPADWTAAAAATTAKNNRVDELIRSGMNRTLADNQAQREILQSLPSLVQKNLFLNGTQLENPARTLLARKNPTLAKFGLDAKASTEPAANYEQFPLGAP